MGLRNRMRRRDFGRDALEHLEQRGTVPRVGFEGAAHLLGNELDLVHAAPPPETIAMFAASAAWRTLAPSIIRHRPVSMARHVAPAFFIAWMVATPTTGTSKRMSWFGLAIFTTVRSRLNVEASPAKVSIIRPARSMV